RCCEAALGTDLIERGGELDLFQPGIGRNRNRRSERNRRPAAPQRVAVGYIAKACGGTNQSRSGDCARMPKDKLVFALFDSPSIDGVLDLESKVPLAITK